MKAKKITVAVEVAAMGMALDKQGGPVMQKFRRSSGVCALFAVALVGLVAPSVGYGAPITGVLNGGFETGTVINGVQIPSDWVHSMNGPQSWDGARRYASGDLNYTPTLDGSWFLPLEWTNGAGASGQQDLGTMATGEEYTFTATMLGNSAWPAAYKISFWDVTDSRLLTSITEATFPVAQGLSVRVPVNMNYTALAADQGDTLRLILDPGHGAVSWAERVGIDSVAVTVTAVPEPSTMSLLGLLGGALFLRRRLRRRNK